MGCRALNSLQIFQQHKKKDVPFPSHLESCSGYSWEIEIEWEKNQNWKDFWVQLEKDTEGLQHHLGFPTDPSTTAGSAHPLPQFKHEKLKFKQDSFWLWRHCSSLLLTFSHTILTLCLLLTLEGRMASCAILGRGAAVVSRVLFAHWHG